MSIVGALTLTLGMVASLPASASINDTSWAAGGSYIRDKDNASSVYVQNTSDYYYATVSVYGRKSNDNTDYEVNRNNKNGQVVVTHDLSIPARSQRLIRQFIYENGNQFAKAVFSGGGSGWWSPDSVGSYTYAN